MLLLALAIAASWGGYSWYRSTQVGEAYGSAFTLVDHNGEKITEQAFRGQPSAVFFGFTHCPEVCPTTLFEMSSWLDDLGQEAANVRPYFVSVDPERDTPEIMKQYIGNFSDRITGITGDPKNVAAMIKGFGIYAKRVDQDDNYTMDHTASVLLLDSGGGLFGTIAYGEAPDNAKAKLTRLAREGR
jgi:protein SCO1/2